MAMADPARSVSLWKARRPQAFLERDRDLPQCRRPIPRKHLRPRPGRRSVCAGQLCTVRRDRHRHCILRGYGGGRPAARPGHVWLVGSSLLRHPGGGDHLSCFRSAVRRLCRPRRVGDEDLCVLDIFRPRLPARHGRSEQVRARRMLRPQCACLPSATARQIDGFCERRISGSS